MKQNNCKMFLFALAATAVIALTGCGLTGNRNESGLPTVSDEASKIRSENKEDENITTQSDETTAVETQQTESESIAAAPDDSNKNTIGNSSAQANTNSTSDISTGSTVPNTPANTEKNTTGSSSSAAQQNTTTSTTKQPVKAETETTAGVSVGNANTRISEQNKEIADNNKTEYVDTSNNSTIKKIYLSEGSSNYKYAYAYVTGSTVLLNSTEKQVFAVVKPLIDNVMQTYNTDPEREKAIHDYIVSNCRYNIEACENIDTMEEYNFHPDGVFLYHEAVCQGYAESFKLCMDLLGIKSDIVTGTGNGQAHAWNAVCLDNEWYQIDCTWDDPLVNGADSGRIYYTYFNITDAQMKKDHVYTYGRACNGTKYNYDYFAEKEYGTIYTIVSV